MPRREATIADVEVHDAIEPIALEWDALVDRAGGSPALRPGWFDAWWRAFGRGGLEIMAVHDSGCVTAVLPLVGRGRRRTGALNNQSWEAWPVADDAVAATRLGRALFDRGLRRVTLRRLNPRRPGLAEVIAAARDAGYHTLVAANEHSPFLELKGTWEEFHASMSVNLRGDLGRRRRRLEEAGEVMIEVLDGTERLDALLAEGLRVEASGWKGEEKTAITSKPELRRFYTDVCRWAAPRDMLRLGFLRVDGRAAAFFLCFEDAGVLYTPKVGYDPEFSRFSPGKLLLAAMIERSFALGLERVDFLGGPDNYKLRFTDTVKDYLRIHAFAPTPTGKAEWAAYRHAAPALKRAGDAVRARRRG